MQDSDTALGFLFPNVCAVLCMCVCVCVQSWWTAWDTMATIDFEFIKSELAMLGM